MVFVKQGILEYRSTQVFILLQMCGLPDTAVS